MKWKRFVNAVRPKQKIKQETKRAWVEEVDDVVREESEEQRKQDGEGSWEKGRPRASAINVRQLSEQGRIEHEKNHLPLRSWCRHCVKGRGREEDGRQSIEEERQVPKILWQLHDHGRREGRG